MGLVKKRREVMKSTTRRSVLGVMGIACGGALASLLPVAAQAQSQPPKRIYIVQSYEKGHVCGEPQAEGILGALAAAGWKVGSNLTVKSYYMDTYRTNAAPEAMVREGQK